MQKSSWFKVTLLTFAEIGIIYSAIVLSNAIPVHITTPSVIERSLLWIGVLLIVIASILIRIVMKEK